MAIIKMQSVRVGQKEVTLSVDTSGASAVNDYLVTLSVVNFVTSTEEYSIAVPYGYAKSLSALLSSVDVLDISKFIKLS